MDAESAETLLRTRCHQWSVLIKASDRQHAAVTEHAYECLGGLMRQFRISRRVSLRQAAKVANLSQAYLSDLERGRRPLNDGLIDRIIASINKIRQ